MKRNTSTALLFGLALMLSGAILSPAVAADATWVLAGTHSAATFSTTHFYFSRVTGTMPVRSVTLVIPEGSAIPIAVKATLDPAGLDTLNSSRDADLRSDRFLGVAAYPQITFESTSVTRVDASHFTVAGNLTIHGVSRPVVLAGSYIGEQGASQTLRLMYDAHTTIDRTQWGITFGAPVVGTSIDIDVKVEAARQ